MPHQVHALRLIRRHGGCFGLFTAPGTGKTLPVIRYAKNHLPMLIICRRDDYLTWDRELEKEKVTSRTYFVTSTRDVPHLGELLDSPEHPLWVFVTYDLIKTDALYWLITNYPWGIVACDESHYIKRWDSWRTKAVIRATRHIPHRIAMTGTPFGNNKGEEIFSQGLFIDDGRTFGAKWWDFMNRFFIKPPKGPGGWFPKKGTKDKIRSLLPRIAWAVDEDDVMSLPPTRRVTIGAPMSGSVRRHYESIVAEWEIALPHRTDEDGDPDPEFLVELDYAISRVSKLRQLAGGFMYLPANHPDGPVRRFKCHKLELLFSMLHDPDHWLSQKKKVVVWCAFTEEIERILRWARQPRHKTLAVPFYGKISRQDKVRSRRAFESDPRVRLFVAQVDSGVGMNELAVADTAIYFSNSPKVVSRVQSERRTRRRGSEHHKTITYVDLVTEGTLDRVHLDALESNIDLATYLTAEIRDRGKTLRELLTQGFSKG
jgi:hypothetical protein